MATTGQERSAQVPSSRWVPSWARLGASRSALVGWLVVAIAAISGAGALADNSFLTHLTTGRLILDGQFPRTDPYSFTANGEPWVVQSWFASVLYAATDKIGHGAGTRAMVSMLSGLLAAVLWRLTRPARSVVARLGAVAPAVIIGIVAWGHRPLLFGLVGFALVLWILREQHDPRWLVPIMWVWVNTHGSFPLGGVLVVVYACGVWCDKGSLIHPRRVFGWLVAGVAVGAINPIGPRLLWFPVELLRKQDVLNHMVEWQAPGFDSPWQQLFLASVVAMVALVPRLGSGDRYRLLLPALVFVALGFTAMRNIGLAMIVLTPLLAAELAGLGSLAGDVRKRVYTAACGVAAVLVLVVVGVRLSEPSFRLDSYPVAAVDWLETDGALGPSERVAAVDFVGNYLEFRSRGTWPVFVDDRVDMYPESVVDDQRVLLHGEPGWRDVLDRWKIDQVIWDPEKPLASLLQESSDWVLREQFTDPDGDDATWVVYGRVSPAAS